MRALVHLDFVTPRARHPLLTSALVVTGIVAVALAFGAHRVLTQRRAALELRIEALTRASRVTPESGARLERQAAATDQSARELTTPWTRLLADLESASTDSSGSVAVLAVEPDHAKHLVHVSGESKNLALAIAYVQRLQSSSLVKYPMLDSHQIRSDDPQRPVRFELTGEWRDQL